MASVWGFAVFTLLAKSNNAGGLLTESIAFSAFSLFELLEAPVRYAIGSFQNAQTVLNSFRRIQEYLLSTEQVDHRVTPGCKVLDLSLSPSCSQDITERKTAEDSTPHRGNFNFAVIAQDASAIYTTAGDPILKDLNFRIPQKKTTIIFGPVGSGKSSFLKLLLGEMPNTSGSVSTSFARAAYCSQSPWITWGTVKSNIIGMSSWDELWYRNVVRVCALSKDFETLMHGDQTNTGSEGSRLSGGQKMRLVSDYTSPQSLSIVTILCSHWLVHCIPKILS